MRYLHRPFAYRALPVVVLHGHGILLHARRVSFHRHSPPLADVSCGRWEEFIPHPLPLSIRALHAHIDNRKRCHPDSRWSSGWRSYLSPLRRIAQTFVLRLHHRPASLSLRLQLPPARKRGSLPLQPRVFPMV